MQGPRHTLAIGDRAPNFVLPAANGKFQMFYDQVKGRPVVLVFATATPVAPFVSLTEDLRSQGIDIFCVTYDSVADNAAANYPVLVWSDQERKITGAFFSQIGQPASAPPGLLTALLLDANQRVLAMQRGPGKDIVAWAETFFSTLPAAEMPQVRPSNAPVLLMPALLTPTMCEELIGLWQTAGHDEGTVGRVAQGNEQDLVYHQAKSRLDHRVTDPQINRVLQMTLGRRIAPELEKAFHFEGFRFDRFLVVCYDAARGDRFRPHRDNTSPTTADRRFALTLNLNSADYEGGELVFPEYGPHKYKPGNGGGVIFSCSLIHEALPVTKGRRFALLNFLRALPGQMPA